MQRRDFLTTTILAGCAAAFCNRASAERGTQVPLEDFFRNPHFDQLALSPDGRRLGCLVSQNKHFNLATIDLINNKVTALTSFSDGNVLEFHWISNERLVFRLQDQLPDPNWPSQGDGLWAVNWDGTESRELLPPTKFDPASVNQGGGNAKGKSLVYRYYDFLEPLEGGDDILMAGTGESADSVDVYRMNTHSGRKSLLTGERPAHVERWVLDRKQQPRVAISFEPETARQVVYYRPSADGAWQRIGEWPLLDNAGFEPVAFDFDGSLLVCARAGDDKAALYRFDLAKGTLGEKLVGMKSFDIGYHNDDNFLAKSAINSLIFDPLQKKLVGLRLFAEKTQFVWLDETWAKWHNALETSLPGRIVDIKQAIVKDTGEQMILVLAYSDVDPGTYYLFEPRNSLLSIFVDHDPPQLGHGRRKSAFSCLS